MIRGNLEISPILTDIVFVRQDAKKGPRSTMALDRRWFVRVRKRKILTTKRWVQQDKKRWRRHIPRCDVFAAAVPANVTSDIVVPALCLWNASRSEQPIISVTWSPHQSIGRIVCSHFGTRIVCQVRILHSARKRPQLQSFQMFGRQKFHRTL